MRRAGESDTKLSEFGSETQASSREGEHSVINVSSPKRL